MCAQLAGAMRIGVTLGREARDALEQAMEVIGAQAGVLRERIERGRCVGCLDAAAGLRDERGLLGAYGGLIGAGAAAWAVTSGFCVGG